MHRFYLPPGECAGPDLTLAGREAHHAVQVLRLRRGDTVQVLDGAGQDLRCAVTDLDRKLVGLRVAERRSVPPLPYRITLFQAIPKGKLFETIIQKSTELGVHRIVPLLTERVVAQLDEEDGSAKAARWRTVAIEAIKQCGSAWLPQIEEPATPRQALSRAEKYDLPLFGSLQPNALHPRTWFEKFGAAHGRRPGSVSVWIGPEGDFSPAEVSLFESSGILPITLGRLVLRTDTAASFCLSFLNYELQAP